MLAYPETVQVGKPLDNAEGDELDVFLYHQAAGVVNESFIRALQTALLAREDLLGVKTVSTGGLHVRLGNQCPPV